MSIALKKIILAAALMIAGPAMAMAEPAGDVCDHFADA
jgi:hypothetical protein